MTEFVIKYWAQFGFSILTGAIAALYKKFRAVKRGQIAILHNALFKECKFYLAQGSISTDALDNIIILYEAYHALGGNGTGTKLYKDVLALPVKEIKL